MAKARKERMEAREMRLRELDKQVEEMEEASDRHYDLIAGSSGLTSADFSSLHRGSVNYPLKTGLIREVSCGVWYLKRINCKHFYLIFRHVPLPTRAQDEAVKILWTPSARAVRTSEK